MREIKFRVWYDGKMIYRNPIMSTHEFYLTPEGSVLFPKEPGKVNGKDHSAVLLQFTGLKDKNGKEIYEGDVLRVDERETSIGVVFFDNAEFKLKIVAYESVTWKLRLKNTSKRNFPEVIGNIYQNPELLTNDQARVNS